MFTVPFPSNRLFEAQQWLAQKRYTATRDYELVATASDRVVVKFYTSAVYQQFVDHFKIIT